MKDLHGPPSRILVVDDEPNVLEAYRRALHTFMPKRDMHFLTSPDEALARMAEHEVDTVVTDILMPGMDGFELIRRLREEHGRKEVPVIVVTCLGATDLPSTAFHNNVNAKERSVVPARTRTRYPDRAGFPQKAGGDDDMDVGHRLVRRRP